MAEQPHTNVSQGSPAGDGAGEAHIADQGRDILHTYEKAKQEMADAIGKLRAEVAKIDVAQARMRTKNWVEENPTLSVFLAAGVGILAGRLLSGILTPAPPPTLTERARKRARLIAAQATHLASDLGDDVSHRASVAGERLAHGAGKTADAVSKRARELSKVVAERAEEVGEVLSHRAGELAGLASVQADRAAHSLQDTAHALQGTAHDVSKKLKKNSKKLQKKAGHGFDVAETMLGAAKTAVAAVLIQQIRSWIKQVT